MEQIAEHANQIFQPYQPSYSYSRDLIHQAIQEYIRAQTPSGPYFQLNIMKHHYVHQARFCSVLLEHAHSDFAYYVILYAMMRVENQNGLPAVLANILQLTSVKEMWAMIHGYLSTRAGVSKTLVDTLELNVIQPVLHEMNRSIFCSPKNMQEYAAFDSSMLCLNVLEARIVESMQCVLENPHRTELKRKR
jgi:hypothetical protein